MQIPSLVSDNYDRRARLTPALLVSLPPALAAACWLPDWSVAQLLAGALSTLGFWSLLAHIGRDAGKRKEPQLFEEWGGKPTTQLLRHRCNDLDLTTKERYRRILSSHLPDTRLASADAEAADWRQADSDYESCVAFLRERTRDRSAFSLIYAENVNYGFRRNLWGMRPTGIVLTLIAIAASITTAVLTAKDGKPQVLPVIATVLNALMLAFWLFRINKGWVREAAFAYAKQLLAACDVLPSPPERESRIFT